MPRLAKGNAVTVQGLTCKFNGFTAVNNISFKVGKGMTFGLLGSNGAGKSTTIKILTTLQTPTSGKAYIAGHDVSSEPNMVRASVGYVPQMFSADAELTGYENLLISAKLYGFPGKEREKRIRELLAYMDLTSHAGDLVRFYSGGMIRKLEIAQAILHKPQVLFLDEPTVGLDPVARQMVWQYIKGLQQSYNTTIMLTTHDMEEADNLCDMLGFMSKGKINVIDTPANLKKKLGQGASLNDVFIHFTGSSIEGGDSYDNVKQMRKAFKARA